MNGTRTTTVEKREEVKEQRVLFLFDVDGTLSPSRESAPVAILNMLSELKKRVETGFVGGSDLKKQKEQIGENVLDLFTYGFPENGVQYYKGNQLRSSESIIQYLGEEGYSAVANNLLKTLGETECPYKRGTFIELRSSMINVSPVGRSCTPEERKAFFEYDKKHKIREKLCRQIEPFLSKHGLVSSIGGQISIDIFPKGWDKTHCLKHLDENIKVVFFGDMTMEGGNDYEISRHPRVHGVTVNGPEDTLVKVDEELKRLGLEPIRK